MARTVRAAVHSAAATERRAMMPTQAEIEAYRTDGVVCLRDVIDQDWIERLREGVAADMAAPGPHVEIYTEALRPRPLLQRLRPLAPCAADEGVRPGGAVRRDRRRALGSVHNHVLLRPGVREGARHRGASRSGIRTSPTWRWTASSSAPTGFRSIPSRRRRRSNSCAAPTAGGAGSHPSTACWTAPVIPAPAFERCPDIEGRARGLRHRLVGAGTRETASSSRG